MVLKASNALVARNMLALVSAGCVAIAVVLAFMLVRQPREERLKKRKKGFEIGLIATSGVGLASLVAAMGFNASVQRDAATRGVERLPARTTRKPLVVSGGGSSSPESADADADADAGTKEKRVSFQEQEEVPKDDDYLARRDRGLAGRRTARGTEVLPCSFYGGSATLAAGVREVATRGERILPLPAGQPQFRRGMRRRQTGLWSQDGTMNEAAVLSGAGAALGSVVGTKPLRLSEDDEAGSPEERAFESMMDARRAKVKAKGKDERARQAASAKEVRRRMRWNSVHAPFKDLVTTPRRPRIGAWRVIR